MAVLRRAVPARFLELVATTEPWSDRPRVLARVVLNAKAPRALSLRLISQLSWRELADVAATAWVPGAVRLRAEALVRESLPDLRLGDRITLARLATAAVLPLLLVDDEPRVVAAALQNPRLREEDLVTAVRREDVPRVLLEACSASSRWSASYALRLALVLQPRTPLSIALLQISSLVPRDLRRVAEARDLRPLVLRRGGGRARERTAPGAPQFSTAQLDTFDRPRPGTLESALCDLRRSRGREGRGANGFVRRKSPARA